MESMPLIYLLPMIVLGSLAGFWALICFAGAMPVLCLHKAQLASLPEAEARDVLQRVLTEGPVPPAWAGEQGFEPTGAYRVLNLPGEPIMVVWSHRAERTYLVVYLLPDGGLSCDMVTVLLKEPGEEDDGGITTGSRSDGLLFPNRATSWMQCFSTPSAVEQWKRHEEAVQYLQQSRGRRTDPQPGDVVADFTDAIANQGRFIRSIPLWWLRIPYWYFVRKNRRFNKPVSELDRLDS